MFTGIIETIGKVINIRRDGNNFHYDISSNISNELKIDQSLAHNGCCLTVVDIKDGIHTVTAIKETIDRTHFKTLKANDLVNLERCMKLNERLDGHIVQGHVDSIAKCIKKEDHHGSTLFGFRLENETKLTVEKGSICINGISLTLVEANSDYFSVAIIPYTMANTTFCNLNINDLVNVEFDIIGKYVARMIEKS
jgi:riboflavin synthase